MKKVKQVIEDVFVTSWSRFLEQQSKNELSLQLKKLSSTFFTTRSTSEATAIVDAEPAADKTELKALIRLECIDETKKLLKQLNDMKNELNNLKSSSKNSIQRGNGSASAKKTKTPNTVTNKNSRNKKKQKTSSSSKKKNTGQNKKGKVADNNKGNDSGAKNSKKKNGKNKSNKNGKPSSNKKHQQNNKSSKK